MKRIMSNKEIADEVLRRATALSAGAKKRRNILMLAGCFVLTLCLTVLPLLNSGVVTAVQTQGSVSAMFDGGVMGGYVLVGVIAFALGAAVTLICLRWKSSQTKQNSKIKRSKKSEQ